MSTETETLKKLRVKRSQCKGTITRIENFVQDPVSLAAASADILEARKEKLISTLKDYEKVQMDILGIDEGDSEQVGDIEDKYYSILAKINSSLKMLNTKVTSECHNASTCKLPTIEIPFYDGKDFTKFKPFFDLFSAVIDNNNSLSDVQKLFYLRKYLQEDALAVIVNLPLVNESYKEAIHLLKRRFDNKARLIANHISILLDIPTMQKGTAVSIRTFVSQINQQIHALKNLEEPVDKWDMLLISILTRKLDQFTNRAYQLDRDLDTMPTMASFIEYLEKRAIALEDSQQNKHSTCYEGTNKHFNIKSTCYEGVHKSIPKVTNVVSKSLPPCRYCENKDHQIYNCHIFKMLPVAQRQSYVKEKHMCDVCLNNHEGKCKFTFKCKICKQGHNTLLHQERNVSVDKPTIVDVSAHPPSPDAGLHKN
ncbi:uncharacterized protein LOC125237004 isoform X1 [Leguminivora glycinivorella]|uniref:uncharacterized protein LOC125237004 isoform X1 n=1 Tax=Leguminivora glycinivorella TaxID=1035111 RepID=UPI00200ED27E|nr:uncharacterized protein LOC125237004 isoform X1 [Leguminivora glycinivorella]